jgi:cupin superfamily acireductone dioxygenase involved in methionine salvage
LPDESNRDRALKELQVYFSLLANHLGLKEGPNREERTLYSLRHTCIMYRLMYGQGIDLLTLARNARTSPEMIDRFYARHLHGEMNLELIQSKRSRRIQSVTSTSS